MSWKDEYNFDVKIDVSWKCPRCGYIQKIINANLNENIFCKNDDCEPGQVYFWLSLKGRCRAKRTQVHLRKMK